MHKFKVDVTIQISFKRFFFIAHYRVKGIKFLHLIRGKVLLKVISILSIQ